MQEKSYLFCILLNAYLYFIVTTFRELRIMENIGTFVTFLNTYPSIYDPCQALRGSDFECHFFISHPFASLSRRTQTRQKTLYAGGLSSG